MLDINLTLKIIKPIPENIGEVLDDVEFNSDLLDSIPKAWFMK
jgi:hypothetical protein